MALPSYPVLRVLLQELITSERSPRVPEPDLVMDDPDKVLAYTQAGREGGVMAPVYLYHAAQICEILRENDTVVDLGCGPANQLAMVARLNPRTRFIGIDLSPAMLARARALVAEMGLCNVELRQGDITNLAGLGEASVDAVFSTVALHHLPNIESLNRAFAEIARILRPGGGLYLLDFGHLHAEASIRYFAYQYQDRQPELFTLDYLYSLRAAFHLPDLKRAWARHLSSRSRIYHTFLVPYMVAIKSQPRRMIDLRLKQALLDIKRTLPRHHQRDFADLATFFRLGGLKSAI